MAPQWGGPGSPGSRLVLVGLTVLLAAALGNPLLVAGEGSSSRKLVAAEGAAGDTLGTSVAIDGDTTIVGAPRHGDSGSAFVFSRLLGDWTEEEELRPAGAAAGEWVGRSVAIVGNVALVGSPGTDDLGTNSGSAYIFTRTALGWSEGPQLFASDGAERHFFGKSVAMSGDTAIVGSVFDHGFAGNWDGFKAGRAYVFQQQSSGWTQVQRFPPSGAGIGGQFGWSVDIDGDRAIVGAPYQSNGATAAGGAYVFERSGGIWSQVAHLVPPSPNAWALFGFSVAIDGDKAVVAAVYDDFAVTDAGGAYAYKRGEQGWILEQRLTNPVAASGSSLGFSSTLEGDRAVLGALGLGNGGEALIFDYDGNVWQSHSRWTPTDAGFGFGVSVAMSQGTAVVGMDGDDDLGTASGSAYVFQDEATSVPLHLLYLDGATHPFQLGAPWEVGLTMDVGIVGLYYGEGETHCPTCMDRFAVDVNSPWLGPGSHPDDDCGTPLLPVEVGIVRIVRVNTGSTLGNYVVIEHADNYASLYSHMQEVFVSEGQNVGRGTLLGTMGKTGLAESCHLHFALFEDWSLAQWPARTSTPLGSLSGWLLPPEEPLVENEGALVTSEAR